MLLGEMQDLARQVAERPIPKPLWYAAVRSAISAAGRYDERLELFTEESATVAANTTEIAMPTGFNIGQLLAVFRDDGFGKRTRLLRWRELDAPLNGLWQEAHPCRPMLPTWDTPRLGFISFAPVQEIALPVFLKLRFIPTADDDEVPEYLLFGALEWLGRNLLQANNVGEWSATFNANLEGEVARMITASSHPIRLGG